MFNPSGVELIARNSYIVDSPTLLMNATASPQASTPIYSQRCQLSNLRCYLVYLKTCDRCTGESVHERFYLHLCHDLGERVCIGRVRRTLLINKEIFELQWLIGVRDTDSINPGSVADLLDSDRHRHESR